MTNTKQFIQDAIEGGYDSPAVEDTWYDIYPVLLDPLTWQAVGKTRGWGGGEDTHGGRLRHRDWPEYWHTFIDHLADGKNIEEALSELV